MCDVVIRDNRNDNEDEGCTWVQIYYQEAIDIWNEVKTKNIFKFCWFFIDSSLPPSLLTFYLENICSELKLLYPPLSKVSQNCTVNDIWVLIEHILKKGVNRHTNSQCSVPLLIKIEIQIENTKICSLHFHQYIIFFQKYAICMYFILQLIYYWHKTIVKGNI